MLFKTEMRRKLVYECPKTNLVFSTYTSGMSPEVIKQKLESQGYILISLGELELNQ